MEFPEEFLILFILTLAIIVTLPSSIYLCFLSPSCISSLVLSALYSALPQSLASVLLSFSVPPHPAKNPNMLSPVKVTSSSMSLLLVHSFSPLGHSTIPQASLFSLSHTSSTINSFPVLLSLAQALLSILCTTLHQIHTS